jgi:hypothetical protein
MKPAYLPAESVIATIKLRVLILSLIRSKRALGNQIKAATLRT